MRCCFLLAGALACRILTITATEILKRTSPLRAGFLKISTCPHLSIRHDQLATMKYPVETSLVGCSKGTSFSTSNNTITPTVATVTMGIILCLEVSVVNLEHSKTNRTEHIDNLVPIIEHAYYWAIVLLDDF